jgi:hypothetical protein
MSRRRRIVLIRAMCATTPVLKCPWGQSKPATRAQLKTGQALSGRALTPASHISATC